MDDTASQLAERIHEGGALMLPLFIWAALSPLLGLALFVLGVALPRKVWALRFAGVAVVSAVGVPLLAWAAAVAKAKTETAAALAVAPPGDHDTLRYAIEAEAMNLPWAGLMGTPVLLAFGLTLLGVALWEHPAVTKNR